MPRIMFMTTKERKKDGIHTNNQGKASDSEAGRNPQDGREGNNSL